MGKQSLRCRLINALAARWKAESSDNDIKDVLHIIEERSCQNKSINSQQGTQAVLVSANWTRARACYHCFLPGCKRSTDIPWEEKEVHAWNRVALLKRI